MSMTGVGSVDQRCYASSYGRFNTPDPYKALAGGANDPSSPRSWNKYAYVGGDPINKFDPRGLLEADPDGFCPAEAETCNDGNDPGGGGGGAGGGGGGGGTSQPAPQCDAELFTRPVTFLGVSLGPLGTHSYLEVWDPSGNEITIEGGPANPGNFLNLGLLVSFETANGVHYLGPIGDNPGTDSHQGAYVAPCSDVAAAIADGASFSTTATYSGPFGPNSNSFLNYLLNVSGLSYLFQVPVGSVGWSNTSFLPNSPPILPPMSGPPSPGKGGVTVGVPVLPRLGN